MKKITDVFLIILLCFGGCISCRDKNKADIEEKINYWTGREILFPNNMTYISFPDTIELSLSNYKFKLLTITDAEGCVACRLKLREWIHFNEEVTSIRDSDVCIVKYISPKRSREALFELKQSGYKYPVCIDMEGMIDSLNHFPKNDNYRCFLLDENNKILLVGNPIQNSKIKELYLRTICEGLGIKQEETTATNDFYKNLGSFDWHETKTTDFILHNRDNTAWYIDSIYTSCECTSATISEHTLAPNDSASISVYFKADKPENFMREIYLRIKGRDEIVFTIEGNAIE